MYAGGIADKIGNRYEAKLLVNKVLLVILAEDLNWIRFEGISEEYRGFEFATGKDNKTEWYQTKITSSHGNWTINKLKNEEVLQSFATRLDNDPKCSCYFISEHPAKELSILCKKARVANTRDEYLSTLSNSKEQRKWFADISRVWETNDDETFLRLRRSYFQVWPQGEIEASNRVYASILFSNSHDDIFAILRDYLEENINKRLTTELVRQFLRGKNIGFKNWQLDPTIKENIEKQTQRYLDTYIPFGAGGIEINRRETVQVIQELQKEEGAQIILLTGVAGCGKSGIIRAVVEFLQKKETIHLAFRVDQYLDCNTPEEICTKILDRNESPVITLHGVSKGKTGVLIVDQVDAVSEVSGRNGAAKNAILAFLDGINELKTKIIYVCRDFDLDNDARLKTLEQKNIVSRIKVDFLDFEEEVKPVFVKKGIKTNAFSKGQKDLLRLPLNLSLFLEVGDAKLAFSNRDDLFDALVKKKSRDLVQRNFRWSLLEPLTALSTWMSNQQKLSAPSYILDIYSQAENILASESLIIVREKQINFFHESFFDYIYARNFLRSKQSIIELLLTTEQHLFRRTQVRQILEVLRPYDHLRYIDELRSLFTDKVRFHVQIAVAQWLGMLKIPTEQERLLGVSLDNTITEGFASLARSILLGESGWFDAHDKSDWLWNILNGEDEQRSDTLLWWLMRIAHERPEGVAQVLRNWWGGNSERASKLLQRSSLVTTKDVGDRIQPIEKLYCDLLESHPEILFKNKTRYNRDLIFYTWVKENSGRGSAILKSYFDAWFSVHPKDQPFSYNHISSLDLHTLSEAAKENPAEFILGVLNALNKSIDVINERKKKGVWVSTFKSFDENNCHGDDKFVKSLRLAFKSIARQKPALAHDYLEHLNPRKHKLFLHLHLEAYAECPKFFKQQFISLLDCKNLLKAGCNGIEWKSFATVARGLLPHLNDAERFQIENTIKFYTPELDYALEVLKKSNESEKRWVLNHLSESGYEQWCVLETIGEKNLSRELLKFLMQMRRKFTDRKVGDTKRINGIRGINSPISKEHALYMSDLQWLRAIGKYQNREKHNNRFVGGADQLAQILRECTEQNPHRFSTLLLQIPQNANPAYTREVLYGLSRSKSCPLKNIKAAIDYAEKIPERIFGLEISRLIERHPTVCEEKKYFELLVYYACNGTADDNIIKREKKNDGKEEITVIEDVIHRTNDLYASGVNDVRGAAILALSQVYWKFPHYSELVESLIKERIDKEEVTSVRCVIIDLLIPFYNYDRKKCGRYYQNLVLHSPDQEKKIEIIASNNGIRLLQYISCGVPNIGENLIKILTKSTKKKYQLVGGWLVFAANYQLNRYSELYEKQLDKGVEYRRLAAQVTAQYFSETEFKEKAFQDLILFFNDDDTYVQNNAATAFREIEAKEVKNNYDLLEAYLESKASFEDNFDFLRLLKSATSDVSEYVIRIAEKIIKDLNSTKKNNRERRRDFASLEELLQAGYVSSENTPDFRKKYLDIIDSLLKLEIYGSERIIKTHDRHY